MKKEVTILLIGIVVCSSIGIFVPLLSGQHVEQPIEPLIDDCDCQSQQDGITTPFGKGYTVMCHPIDCSQLRITTPSRPLRDLPEAFSWKNVDGVDWTTVAKHQGNCGSCWDFAALGALESRIKISEQCAQLPLDLSEQYVLSCRPAAANSYGEGCYGGTPYGAYYYIMNTTEEGNKANGIILESCFPYEASHMVSCDEKCEDWMEQLIPLSACNLTFFDLGYATEENTNIIKTILYEEGPIAVALNVTQEFITYWNIHHSADVYFPDTHEPWGNMLNHIVMLVGWKDDASIKNGGYWIVKNSWGTDWGYDGFFNLEYYALFFGMYYATATYDPESVDWAPTADTGGFYVAETEETIPFDGTASFDPEGVLVSYEWEFGDGSTESGPTPTHSYAENGVYVVTLTVTDSGGNNATDFALVGIGEEPLYIDAAGILGVDIQVESRSDHPVTTLEWTVEFFGLVLKRDFRGTISLLSDEQMFTHHIPVFGLGFGTLTIDVEHIKHTERFFMLGPSVFGLRFQ